MQVPFRRSFFRLLDFPLNFDGLKCSKCPNLKGTSKHQIPLEFLQQVMNAFCYISPNFSGLSPASFYQPPVHFFGSFLTLHPGKPPSVPNQVSAGVSQGYPSMICMLHGHSLIYLLSTYIRHGILHQSGRERAETQTSN